MTMWQSISSRIINRDQLIAHRSRWTFLGQKVVFTNGCFDILHEGHLRYLADARDLGDVLVVGVNSDASVSRLKGPERPVNTQESRMLMLAGLLVADAVILFEEDTPLDLIHLVRPDVLVKGGDWSPEQIVGSSLVLGYGGEVHSLPFHAGFSTTEIIRKIREL